MAYMTNNCNKLYNISLKGNKPEVFYIITPALVVPFKCAPTC